MTNIIIIIIIITTITTLHVSPSAGQEAIPHPP
jgi:hypothetical protein